MSKYGQKSISHKLTSNYKKISDEIEIGDSFLSLTNYIYIFLNPKSALCFMEKHEMRFYLSEEKYKNAHYLSYNLKPY